VDDAALQYLTERHCSGQWRDFLDVLGDELHAQLGEDGTAALMARTGSRFAERFPPGPCATLADLERALAQIWLDVDWGWTSIQDTGEALLVRHHCAPLHRAPEHPQDVAGRWPAAFLQGAYAHWFRALGSSDALHLTQASGFDATGSVDFRFGK
jgi:hypothetical protein